MKNKSIYERFTLKQQIGISRQAETMRTLNSELKKSQELVQQLTEIANQTEIKTGETNAISLRSSSWYGTRVQEQLETSKNRNKFLQKEVDDSNKLFKKNNWPIIDVTRRSVEETAASILKIIEIKKNK